MLSQNFSMHLRREYWESRNWLLGLPLLLVTFISLAIILLTQISDHIQTTVSESPFSSENQGIVLNFGDGAQPLDETKTEQPESEDDDINVRFKFDGHDNLSGLSMLELFINFGWIGALCYLSTSLYSDRKDASILFWKSLPVSDTEQVLSKFFFAVISFPLVSLLIGWLFLAILLVLDATYYAANDLDLVRSLGNNNWLLTYLITPLTGYCLGFVKGIPVLAFTMLVSAIAKRLPYLWLIIPLLAAALTEQIIANSYFVVSWFITHFPIIESEVFEQLTANYGGFLFHHFARNAVDFVINISLGALIIFACIWLRKHRFEI